MLGGGVGVFTFLGGFRIGLRMISGDSGGVVSLGLGLGDLWGGVGTLLRGLTRVEVGETRAESAARLTRREAGAEGAGER